MFGLSEDFPFMALVGCELIQICIGENELIMNFDKKLSISINSSVVFGPNPVLKTDDYRCNSNLFAQLLGSKIADAQSSNKKDLMLNFTNGKSVTILDEYSNYEAYFVKIGDKSYVT